MFYYQKVNFSQGIIHLFNISPFWIQSRFGIYPYASHSSEIYKTFPMSSSMVTRHEILQVSLLHNWITTESRNTGTDWIELNSIEGEHLYKPEYRAETETMSKNSVTDLFCLKISHHLSKVLRFFTFSFQEKQRKKN